MWAYFWVGLGGALGSVARLWLSGWVARHSADAFPWGTLVVNVSGSFALGLAASLAVTEGRWMAGPGFRQFFMFGVCGGYTTFSTFSLQTLELMQAGEWLSAVLNAVGSVVACLLAVWSGHAMGVWMR
jgi:CrcB protein